MRFVFVHGGFHAAWCWDHTIAELDRRGHEAVAVDLPGHGTRVDDALAAWTIPNRRDAIVEALRPGDVLVGHSGGGFDATVAADAATEKISHIVYLAAALPREGRTYPEAMAMRNNEDGQFDGDVGEMLGYLHFAEDGAMTFADFDGAWRYFYHDCDERTARWAFDRLGPEKFGAVERHPGVGAPVLGRRPAAQLHPVHRGPLDAALARRHRRRAPRRRAADHRHLAFAVPEPAGRTGRAAAARHHDDTGRPTAAD